jgi:hypothetical protein
VAQPDRAGQPGGAGQCAGDTAGLLS